jgi:alpha-D-ribose 1-methylphosphonate 5-triphosphate diphosphatase
MIEQTILTNARIVSPDRDFEGSLVIENGLIIDVLSRQLAGGIDMRGAVLIPGIIDIHTDYLERELAPRPSARIPLDLAMHVLDMRALSFGLTTIASAARISEEKDGMLGSWRSDGLLLARKMEELLPHLRARHMIHIRWSTSFEPIGEILDELLKLKNIANLVFNDDTPGQRQFRNVDLEAMLQQRANNRKISLEEARKDWEERIERATRVNNRKTVQAHTAGRIPLGSHDDTTVEHVVEAHECGVTLSEMPCSIEAARKAKELGMLVCMGAPNYYRGGSHCGNLSCHEAMAENLVDIICSDYHFPSMLASAVRMVDDGMSLSAAINMLTLHPARHLHLDKEIGSIEAGKRADLAAFYPRSGFGDVVRVWVDGKETLAASAADGFAGSHEASEQLRSAAASM